MTKQCGSLSVQSAFEANKGRHEIEMREKLRRNERNSRTFRLGTWSWDVASGARWLYLAVVARVVGGWEAALQNIHPLPSGGKAGWRQVFVIAFLSRCSSNRQVVNCCIMRSDGGWHFSCIRSIVLTDGITPLSGVAISCGGHSWRLDDDGTSREQTMGD